MSELNINPRTAALGQQSGMEGGLRTWLYFEIRVGRSAGSLQPSVGSLSSWLQCQSNSDFSHCLCRTAPHQRLSRQLISDRLQDHLLCGLSTCHIYRLLLQNSISFISVAFSFHSRLHPICFPGKKQDRPEFLQTII